MFNSLPKHSGIYSVKDDIDNLQIKINFRSINTTLKLPKYTVFPHANKQSDKPSVGTNNPAPDDEEIMLIKWQQKIFSSTESQLYSDLSNCTNDQQRKYHEILKVKDRSKKHSKRTKGQRKQAKSEVEATTNNGNFIFTYVHEDNFSNSSEDSDKYVKGKMEHYDEEPFEEMFVYAALNPHTQLAVLRWFPRQHILYIYPDFTDCENRPYIIEIDSDYRHLYSYGIKDISLKALPASNVQEQFLYLPELPTHWRMEDEIGKQFSMPPRRTQRCAIIFAINTVSGFEYDNVHIRYSIKLPEHTILEEGLLDATSHSASSSIANSILHIGLSWQITVLCEEQFDPSQHLRIFFEVISIDVWERERIEGFSHYSVKLLQPCDHTVKLHCIRPVETFLESINRYFIGGRRKFNYERFVCAQDNGKEEQDLSNFHCRYGERMQNSGEINFTCQILMQRNCGLLNPCSSRTSGMTLDDIMMAYKEARRRLEAVSLNRNILK